MAQSHLGKEQTLRLAPSGQLLHTHAELSIPEGPKITFSLRGVPVALTSTTVESGHKPVRVQRQIKKVEILIDRTSIEAFANQGEVSSTRYALPKSSGLSVKAEGGAITIHSLAAAMSSRRFRA